MSLLEKSQSVELSRRTQPFYAKRQTYDLNRQVQVEIDVQREYLDMESMRVAFDLKVVVGALTASTIKSHPWLAGSIIKNLRYKTLSGSLIGSEIVEYRSAHRYSRLTY